jgi:hypothetical protein
MHRLGDRFYAMTTAHIGHIKSRHTGTPEKLVETDYSIF